METRGYGDSPISSNGLAGKRNRHIQTAHYDHRNHDGFNEKRIGCDHKDRDVLPAWTRQF
jgi:hypothetical protein